MSTFSTTLESTPVLVRYQYEPGCIGGRDHPDSDAYVEITEVGIGGAWIGPSFLQDDWVDKTERAILADLVARAREEAVEAV